MTHKATNVAMVEGRAERLRQRICRIHDARDMGKNNLLVCFPFLKSEMLNVNVTSAWCWSAGVDHEDRRGVIFKQSGRTKLWVSEFEKDRPKVLGNFRGVDGSEEFGFSRAGGNRGLNFGLVRQRTAAEHKNQASNRAACDEIGCMCSINVSGKV